MRCTTGAELITEKCQKKNNRKHEWFQYSAHLASFIITWQQQRNSRTKASCFILCETDSSRQGQHCQEVAFIVQVKDELTRTLSRWQIDTQNTVNNQWQEAWVALLRSLPSEDRGLSFDTLLLSKLKTPQYLSRGTSPHVILNFESRAFQTLGSACVMLWGEEAARREQKTISLSVSEETEHFTVSLSSGDSPLCVTPQLTNSNSHTQTHTHRHSPEHSQKKRWARESVNWRFCHNRNDVVHPQQQLLLSATTVSDRLFQPSWKHKTPAYVVFGKLVPNMGFCCSDVCNWHVN